jgi:hypothetical protein
MNNNERLVLDRANFPMLWVEGLKAHVHLLPVTKIQYEYYLWDAPNPGLDQQWYDQVTKDNKRISPQAVTKDDYWRLFITAVLPSEAKLYAEWCSGQSGDTKYFLPDATQWQAAYRHFKESKEGDPFQAALELPGLAPRCRTILEKLPKVADAPSLAERLLFRGGVMEWVSDPQSGWGLFGHPSVRFVSMGRDPNTSSKPLYPAKPEDTQARHRTYGFRLLRQKLA